MSSNLFFLIILSINLVSIYGKENICPNDTETVQLNLKEFSKNDWYMVAATPVTGDVGSCVKLRVKSSGSNMSANYTTTSYRGKHPRITWHISGEQKSDGLTAKWELNSKVIMDYWPHKVLKIDYKRYCVMVICGTGSTSNYNHFIGMILSRNKTLPEDLLIELKSSLSKYVKTTILDVDNTCPGISE